MIGDFAEGDGPAEFASPACFMHEVDPSYSGLGATSPELQRRAILRWRKSERQRLIVQRLGISSRDGIRCARGIAAQLDALLPDLTSIVVSLFWPFRGEPDLRNWADSIRARGAVCVLPVVVEKNAPLIFRRWRAGGPLARGVWNIPVPADGPELAPDVVIAPLVVMTDKVTASGMEAASSIGRWPPFQKSRAPSAWAAARRPSRRSTRFPTTYRWT
jgi:5,10-methenyltetrahydrofolate synthetase